MPLFRVILSEAPGFFSAQPQPISHFREQNIKNYFAAVVVSGSHMMRSSLQIRQTTMQEADAEIWIGFCVLKPDVCKMLVAKTDVVQR